MHRAILYYHADAPCPSSTSGWSAGHEQGFAAWPSDPLTSSVTCWINNWSSIVARYHIYGSNSPPCLMLLPHCLHAPLRITLHPQYRLPLNLSEGVHCAAPPTTAISTVLYEILQRYSVISSFLISSLSHTSYLLTIMRVCMYTDEYVLLCVFVDVQVYSICI